MHKPINMNKNFPSFFFFVIVCLIIFSCESKSQLMEKENLKHFSNDKISIESDIKSLELQLKFANEKLERAKAWHPGDKLFPARKEDRIRNAEQNLLLVQNELDSKENALRAVNDSIRRIELQLKY